MTGFAWLNPALERSRQDAERHYAELERIYTRLIVQAGREAASALIASAQVTPMAAAANGGATPDWQIPPEGALFAVGVWAQRAVKRIGKLHQRIVRAVTGPPLARVGIAWDITHPLSQALLNSAGERTGVRLGFGVQDVIRETVAGAYAEGLPVRDAAKLLEEKLTMAAPGQAQMLARTDLNSLSNGGSVMAARMVGVTYKTWLTAEDDKVREEHVDADGQTVPIDQPFDVCGESLDYPADPSGSDACCCNCRCTVLYSDSLDGETASAHPLGRVPSRGMATRAAGTSVRNPPRVPSRGFAVAPSVAAPTPDTAAVSVSAQWVSDLAFEGVATSDGRYILADALTWRDLPLTLGIMYDTPHADVITESPVAGRIDSIAKDDGYDMDGEALPAGVTAMRGHGEFDMAGHDGTEALRLVGDKTMRGVSIDLAVDEWTWRDPETGDLISPDDATEADMERAMFGELQYAVVKGTIMAATVCPTPAFADARIALTASGDKRVIRLWATLKLAGTEVLTASAAGLAPVKPPAAWFRKPEADRPTPLTVTADGQVYGHVALWNSCHLGYPGACITPPRSPSDYAYFNLGAVECDDGSTVAAGSLTLEGLHAETKGRSYSPNPVKAHYENTAVVAAFVRAVDGIHGIWVAGTLRAGLSERHARDLMAAKPSGDWQPVRPGGANEMVGLLAVNRPGFPVPRLVASGLVDEELVAEVHAEGGGRVPARGFARAV